MRRKQIDEHTRFLDKVELFVGNPCWEWTGAKYRFGYGHFRRKINNKWIMYKAHRYSYETFKEQIPPGLLVLHKCDNPGCVNPEHLFIGIHKDNTLDKINKNRMPLIRNPRHRLLDLEIARAIRAYKTAYPQTKLKELAFNFKTSIQQISRILKNKIWQEVL